jgi:hypothetical protein
LEVGFTSHYPKKSTPLVKKNIMNTYSNSLSLFNKDKLCAVLTSLLKKYGNVLGVGMLLEFSTDRYMGG